ncbi:MAG: branched-chain amino acid aminotransferase [Bacteroidia bacterium]|nr:branched-chain amino acid aminotransferase [Bacteroidia bacterium]
METETLDIKITKTAKSRVHDQDVNNVPFGKVFSDHMFVAEFENGKWSKAYIEPYREIPMSYALAALHYGQAIFEGMKAYKDVNGHVSLFRPQNNFHRLNKSAIRMAMPEVPEELFFGALTELLKLDSEWVPTGDTGSLYIRPFMISTDEAIGVRPSDTYKFIVISCPAGKYYSEPVRVLIEHNYIRAVHGGVGFVKAAGNYGRSLYPTKLAMEKGFQQVIWTDAETHTFVEESGTMNLMFLIGDTIITPALSDTILDGITRNSVLAVAKDWGYKIEERKISIAEIVEAHKKGTLNEAFGTGTAATIAHISAIGLDDVVMELPSVEKRAFSPKVDEYLRNLRKGIENDKFGWMYKIC